jgi:hypothetical protein
MKNESPIGLALILCDMVIQDKETHKRSLIGMFDRLYAAQFPCIHPAMYVYVSATSGKGDYDTAIVCRHQASGQRVLAINGKIRFADPLQVVEVVCQIQRPKFDEPGEYWLEFCIDEVPVMMRRLIIEQAPPPPARNGRN